MKKNLHITLVQANLYWENKSLNLTHFDSLISEIEDTDIILLPEMFNTSFCPQSNHFAEPMDGKTVRWMKLKSKENNCSIAGTLMVYENNKVYNRLVWVSKNGTINTYDKYHLFSLASEEKYISKGSKRLIIDERGWKICPLICYDLRFPVFSRNNVDYDILIYLANWPSRRIDAWETLIKARAIENQSVTIGVNRIGKDGNGTLFNGRSLAFDPFGVQICSTRDNKEEVKTMILEKETIQYQKNKINFLKDRDNFFIE